MDTPQKNTTVGILLFDGAEELDYIGPWEVFQIAARFDPSFSVLAVAESDAPVRSSHGLRVLADTRLASAPHIDVLLAPGGPGARRLEKGAAEVAWLEKAAPTARWITSVCTGAFLLHTAGLLAGKRVTTHHAWTGPLRERGGVTVLEDVRYVRDGNVLTAAGISAGIDMSLWLIGQLRTPALARRVQRQMQYEPAPPYAAEV